MSDRIGTVYWLTGLSGAGKTTIGKLLYEKLRSIKPNVVFLDGDILREVFGGDLGYTREERHISAMRNARICQMLSAQGMDVVCCTISMFDDVRAWNREHISAYREIYLKVPPEVLMKRNQKGLYESSKEALVGFGVEMEEPKQPDLVLVNDGTIPPETMVGKIWNSLYAKETSSLRLD